MEAIAKLRNCGMSARKARLVADLIRNKKVDEALDILRFTKKEACYHIEKTLLSAIANWEQKLDMMENADDFDLVVKRITVDDAPQLKRIQPAPQGRAHRIRKRYCHINVVVENSIPLPVRVDDEEIEDEVEYEEELTENVE